MSAEIFHFQLDLFETEQERANRLLLESIQRTNDQTKQSLDRVRKGTYASINEMKRDIALLTEKLGIIERYLCTGNKTL